METRGGRLRALRQNPPPPRGPINEQVFHALLKNLGIIIVLWASMSNPLPGIASAKLGPSIYLTIKTISCLMFLELLMWLDYHRDNIALLTLVLLAFRFATVSVYDPCIAVSLGDRHFCNMESLIIAAAGMISLLALSWWAAIKEWRRRPLEIVSLVYLASTVVDFSRLDMAHISSILISWVLVPLDLFHISGFLDDHVYNQIEFVKSEVGYYLFPSFVIICSVNALVTVLLVNLKGTLL